MKNYSDYDYRDQDAYRIFKDALPEYTLTNVNVSAGLPEDSHGIYIGSDISSTISKLGDVFKEWFLFNLDVSRDIKTFLHDEKLDSIFTEKQFIDLMCGEAYLDELLVFFICEKLPFDIQESKLHTLNHLAMENSKAYCVVMDSVAANDVVEQLEAQSKEYKEKRKILNRGWSKKYRDKNAEEINAKQRAKRANNPGVRERESQYRRRPDVKERARISSQKYKKNNPEKVKAQRKRYREEHREEIRERERARYYANHEHCKELSRKNAAAYAKRHPEKKKETSKRCYANWIAKHKKERAEYKHNYNQEHAAEIADKKRKIRELTRTLMVKCPVLAFIMKLKTEDLALYLSLYTKNQNPALPAIRGCSAVLNMDFNQCPILQNQNISDEEMTKQCLLSGCMKLDGASAQIREIAAKFKQDLYQK